MDKENVSSKDLSNLIMTEILNLEGRYEKSLISGNFRDESADIIASYTHAKTSDEVGSPTGFKAIDDATRGIKKGEFWLTAAYTSEGKSMWLNNLMWTNAVLYGRNVVYASGEMPKDQIRQWILARHSQHPKFEGLGQPLGLTDLRDGTLSPAQERFFLETVVPDFTTSKEYGQMQVFQIYGGMTVSDLYRTLKYYRAQFDIDLFIIDMVQHLSGDSHKESFQIELQDNIMRLKQMAVTFNDGEGLPIITGYQVTRNAREKAEKMDGYENAALAYTAEAERSSDVVLWLLRKEAYKKVREVRLGMTKNRGGYIMEPYMVSERYENAYIAEYPEGYGSKYVPETPTDSEDGDDAPSGRVTI
jgi:replicative DNA helicase